MTTPKQTEAPCITLAEKIRKRIMHIVKERNAEHARLVREGNKVGFNGILISDEIEIMLNVCCEEMGITRNLLEAFVCEEGKFILVEPGDDPDFPWAVYGDCGKITDKKSLANIEWMYGPSGANRNIIIKNSSSFGKKKTESCNG